jgi:hypothetical protein
MLIRHKKIAVCGIIAALSLAMMFLSAVVPFSTFAAPAIAGLLMLAIKLEYGTKSAIVTFFAVSILSAMLVPQKETAVVFAAFLGFYPIIKTSLDKLKSRLAGWTIKLFIFNAAITSAYLLMLYVLGLDEVFEDGLGVIITPLLMISANVIFILYDLAVNRFVYEYRFRLRRYFNKRDA